MPRRGRRSGVRFLEDDKERSLTFFKRRAGIYKIASDLSTLTGARIAVVLESENGKISSFGTPSVEPVVDTFLSGHVAIDPFANEEQKARITLLQNQVFQLEKEKALEDKRKKESMVQAKEAQESSRMAKLIFTKEEDLDTNELYELLRELSLVQQEIRQRLPPPQHHGNQLGVGGLRDPPSQQSPRPHIPSSQISPPLGHSPWTPFQPSLQDCQPSWSHSMAQASFPTPVMLPFQPHMMPSHHDIWGMDANINNSDSFSPILPLPLSPQFPLSQPLESQVPHLGALNNNWVEPPQNYAWQMDLDFGNTGDNGGQASDSHNMLGFPGPIQGDGWTGVVSDSFSPGGSFGGADAGNIFGDVNFPSY
ncbi:hypothetical protein ACP70R_037834 [Stipagrostis hirtigluma subsp. patula]